jgi:uncharacterized membrane protein YgcG
MRTLRSLMLVLGTASLFSACDGADDKSHGASSGFGQACDLDEDCEEFSLVCDTVRGCVQCLDYRDCKNGEFCNAGKCEKEAGCKDDRDCKNGQTCITSVGQCAECASSKDCGKNEICVALECVEAATCAEGEKCPKGLICDEDEGACVECLKTRDCDSSQVCEDQTCVPAGDEPSGAGGDGSGGSNSSGGKDNSGGSNSSGGKDSSGGSNSSGGTGGTKPSCDCGGGLVCDKKGVCVDPRMLDDLSDCDEFITEVAGRHGTWYGAADSGINHTFLVSKPGSGWGDQSCAAWTTGGPLNTGTQEWAVIGFEIAGGSAYDLSDYQGVNVTFESADDILVIVKTSGGGYFADYAAKTGSTSLTRKVYFDEMFAMANSSEVTLDLTEVIEFQFSPYDPKSFGFAIHRVSLF